MKLLLPILVVLCCTKLSAQSFQADSTLLARQDSIYRADQGRYYAHIAVRTFYDGSSVRLRWAPDAPGGWLNANRMGYIVERADMGRPGDTTVTEADAFVSLTPSPLMPLSQQGWKDLNERLPEDLYIMVAGEMIHTALLPENMGFTTDLKGASNVLKERYGFAVLAADLSSAAAEGSALAFTDKTAKPGHTYLYRVRVAGMNSTYPVGDGIATVNTEKAETILRPVASRITMKDSLVMISWSRNLHEAHFTAYDIERSDNGGAWRRINTRPFVSFVNPDIPGTRDVIVYTDTIDTPGAKYSYRLIGLTAFGTRSEPSPVMIATWQDRTPPPSPTNVRATEKNDSIEISWDYPPGIDDLRGFHVTRGSSVSSDDRVLNEKLLPASTRSFIDKSPELLKHNYYLVIAVDTANNPGLSMSALGSITDTIPPARPTGLVGEVDTNGVVTLRWRLGREPDLFGYHVFWQNQRDHVESRLSGTAVRDTMYVDTISMRTLTEKVYYKVMAVDMNKNGSIHSELIELKRPDLRPPTRPVFKDYRVSEDGIWLRWAPSSSEDVVRHCLLRRAVGTTAWDTLLRVAASERRFEHMDRDSGTPAYYEYAVVALDDAGWTTFSLQQPKLRMASRNKPPKVEMLEAEIADDKRSVQLSWDYAPREDTKFILYKSVDKGKWQEFELLPANARKHVDRLVRPGQEVAYYIQVVTTKGRDSDYSPTTRLRL